VTDTPSRLLPLVGAFNFRDLGGYVTMDGHQTRWGRVFRSDTLDALSQEDLEILRDVGLRTVVDLRTKSEAERDGRGLLAAEPVHYVNLSVLPEEGGESVAAPPPEGSSIGARYLWYLEAGASALSTSFRMIADSSTHPLVFHCTAGKDRTGVLSALVLDCLGVDRATIVDDYMHTAAVLHLILDRLRQHPVYGPHLTATQPARFGVEAATMVDFLEGVEQRYGGAAGWARSQGIPDDVIDQLRAALLEP
jgi:protein-tyrosine phosphatase